MSNVTIIWIVMYVVYNVLYDAYMYMYIIFDMKAFLNKCIFIQIQGQPE